ncbi:MAG: sensor histidine kinase [Anaerolineales bacterium]|nr:sensor histidine kinase [Chloroflexota bacterium]MBL6979952.1 sensor histidine kinase [Anaerolineales bacterium]
MKYNLYMTSSAGLILIFFFYGLAFFSMGMIVFLERGRGTDARLRHALRPLIGFGLIHGGHEWMEIFEIMHVLPLQDSAPLMWSSIRIALLSFSFFSLTAFGASLLSPNEKIRRLSMIAPLALAAIWGFGLLVFAGRYDVNGDLWDVADVWTRYVVAIPGALLACMGLIYQQRIFRLAGLEKFSRDSLWSAVAFAWYGLIGQFFTKATSLPPSTFINQDLFLSVFGFPVQLLRAAAAIAVAIFVTRFLRSFEVETQRQIDELQAARLHEAERREALRGEFLRRIVAAQEAERQRIARELHDETGQALTALGLGLRGVSSTIRHDEEKAASNLRQLEGMAVQSLDELRRLISDLRPSHLDDLGLAATIRWYVGEIQERSGVNIDLDIPADEDCNLPSSISTSLFRIVQEAITNVVKHSDADHAWIRLWRNAGIFHLEIEDNGIGFYTQKQFAKGEGAWGLLGMEERASLLGGEFNLRSKPGDGVQIAVKVPCPDEADVED